MSARVSRRSLKSAGVIVAVCFLAGCSFAPRYKTPRVPVPESFKEGGIWTRSTPADTLPKGHWWEIYGNSALNALETRIEVANPNLAEALARYDAAQGYLGELQAGFFPSVAMGGHSYTNRQSDKRPLRSASQPTYYGDNLVGGSLLYDIDLWGRVRNAVAAGKAEMQAQAADLQNVRMSLQAQLADDYVQLRGLDAQAQLLGDTIEIYQKALTLTEDRYKSGIASGLDVGRAETQLEDAKAALSDIASRRALLEHAIASLVGEPASTLSIAAENDAIKIPNVPAGIPSLLLERRPDVAAAERTVDAMNAGIGVARAAFFPDISLSALAGFQTTGGASLLAAPNSYWTLGPTLALTLFDAGRREGALKVARADYDEAAAAYRDRVLRAFQDVEDNLSLLNKLAEEADSKALSVQSSSRTASIAMALYRNGAVSYLDVVTSQTTALQAQLAALNINTRRLEASVRLIQATGGGWSKQDPLVLGKENIKNISPSGTG